jgi:hypothetical protein
VGIISRCLFFSRAAISVASQTVIIPLFSIPFYFFSLCS